MKSRNLISSYFNTLDKMPLSWLAALGITGILLYNVKKEDNKKPVIKPTFEFNCNFLILNTDYKSWLKSLAPKIIDLLKERNITKENVMNLSNTQIIDLYKYWIYKLNPNCLTDTDQIPYEQKKIHIVLFSVLTVKLMQLAQGIPLNSDQLIFNPYELKIYEQKMIYYVNIVQQYLELFYSVEEIEYFIEKLQNSRQFP